jgi:two-component system, LuxR family, sensor kinase FixL
MMKIRMKTYPCGPAGSDSPGGSSGSHGGGAREVNDPLPALHGRLQHVSHMATIGEMAAGVAHELNQPLTAIANYAQACERLLARPDSDPLEVREALREIVGQATRAAEILRRLRALARQQKSEHAWANINAVLHEILELVQADARVHEVALSLELDEELPPVSVDSGEIQQVILNFVRNALDALEARGAGARQLLIRTALTTTREVEVAVIDNGPGLAPGLEERIFDPFFSTKPGYSGLGLAISNTIARAHGGSIGYRANEPAGACFYLCLPDHTA